MFKFLTSVLAKIRQFDIKDSRWFTIEAARTIPLLGLALLLFYPDLETLKVVKYVFGFLFVIALVSHTIRAALFPYINLRDYAKKALDTPLGAGIVFFGFCIIICTIMVVAAGFFR